MLTAFLLIVVSTASADVINIVGATRPLRDVSILGVSAGGVSYSDSSRRIELLALTHIASLSFDQLPDLDEAERAIRRREHAAATRPLARALLRSATDAQRLWIRARLAQTHNALGQYVQAAGHAAAAMQMEPHAAWAALAPSCVPDEPSAAAAIEALHHLQEARAAITQPQLMNSLDQMIARVRPIRDRLARSSRSGQGAYEPNTTVSGIPVGELLDSPAPPAPKKPQPAPLETAGESPVAPPPSTTADSPEAIDALLQSRRFTDAYQLCQRIADKPGNRALSRFLLQYGRAASGIGLKKDAAVLYMQSAVLFPDSPEVNWCLLETAILYRDEFRKPATARRLAERVISQLPGGDDVLLAQARSILNSLPAKER